MHILIPYKAMFCSVEIIYFGYQRQRFLAKFSSCYFQAIWNYVLFLFLLGGWWNCFSFFSSNREFHLVFKYVYVYICFAWRKLLNLHFLPGHKDIKKNGGRFALLFTSFCLCSNLLYFLATLSKKVAFFFYLMENLMLLCKYIWFTYVFSSDKGWFSSFITKAPNLLKNHSPWSPLCRPKPVKYFNTAHRQSSILFCQVAIICNIQWLLYNPHITDVLHVCLALPCFALPRFASLCLALPRFALPCLALPCLALPCLALPCFALLCLALPCFAIYYLLSLIIYHLIHKQTIFKPNYMWQHNKICKIPTNEFLPLITMLTM